MHHAMRGFCRRKSNSNRGRGHHGNLNARLIQRRKGGTVSGSGHTCSTPKSSIRMTEGGNGNGVVTVSDITAMTFFPGLKIFDTPMAAFRSTDAFREAQGCDTWLRSNLRCPMNWIADSKSPL